MKKISILIAAYNVENYIEDALHSAINQTLQDIEILVVDDGSKDKTADIIKQYTTFDNRIQLFTHEKNKGLMLARKTAYLHAKGEYILFLDGDDSLEFDACEKAYNAIKHNNVDILQFEANTFGKMHTPEENAHLTANLNAYMAPLKEKILSRSRAGLLGNNRSKNINFTIWNKLYKKDVVDKVCAYIPEEHITIAEDVLFSYMAAFFAHSYACINDKLYNYRLGSGITTSTSVSEAKIISVAKCLYVYRFLEDFTKKQSAEKLLEQRLEKTKIQLYKHVCHFFLKDLNKNQRNAFTNEILKMCSKEEFVSMLTNDVYTSTTVLPEVYADICSELDIFKTTKTSTKTIGTFCFQMNNGGTERVVSIITDMWIKSGHNVILFTDKPPHSQDYPINPAVKRVVLPELKSTSASHNKRVHAFYNALKEYNVDMFVYHAWNHPQFYIDASIIKSLGIPLIVQVHSVFCVNLLSPDAYTAYSSALWYKMLKFADTVLSLSECDKAYWTAYGLRCIKIINPPTFPLETTPTATLNGKNILCICRLSREKQVLDTLKIFELVLKSVPDAQLTIVGDSEDITYVQTLKNFVKDHELEKSVAFEGFKKDVAPYYARTDLICITSKYEGAPLTLYESKIHGIPVVAYELQNLDAFHPPKGLCYVAQNDVEGAAENIVKILSDFDLKKKMGKEARESAEEIFSQDLFALWEHIFNETLLPRTDIQLSPKDYAIRTLTNYNAIGIKKRGSGNDTEVSFDTEAYLSHVTQLEKTVKELRASTSYKLGWFLTWPFRKIKDKIKGQKYVE